MFYYIYMILFFIQAIRGCTKMGARLAIVASNTTKEAVYPLLGGEKTWIGFTDFLNEKTFEWLDGTTTTEFEDSQWKPGNPNNANDNQHCTQVNADDDPVVWDDVICNKNLQYLCQKDAS